MEEIEVKILDINIEKIVEKLVKLGAKKIFDGPMKSVYLDLRQELRNSNKILRIRQKGEKCIITLKIKKEDSEAKVNDEFETEIKDFQRSMLIFENLGFKEFFADFKKRISYQFKNSLVEIDIYDEIPPFLEVESPTKEELKEVVSLLGYSMDQTKSWTGKELLDLYNSKFK